MPVTTAVKERRRYVRVTPSMSHPIFTTILDKDVRMERIPVRDISLGGVALLLDQPYRRFVEGQPLHQVKIDLPKLGSISASGVVRRFEYLPDTGKAICALEFTRLPSASDRMLFQYINRRQREMHWFSR